MNCSIEARIIHSIHEFKLHGEWLGKSGVYYWCTKKDGNGYLVPYYIGEAANFENRFHDEFGYFLTGRWFSFDVTKAPDFIRVADKINKNSVLDFGIHNDNYPFYMADHQVISNHPFAEYLDQKRMERARQMLENTSWVILVIHEPDDKKNTKFRKDLEHKMIMNYREFVRNELKLDAVPMIRGPRKGSKNLVNKPFIGDWNHRIKKILGKDEKEPIYNVVNSDDLSKPELFLINQLLK